MRLLLITHYFPSHGGGIEMVALRLAEQFAGRGHRIVWMASGVDAVPAAIEGIEYRAIPAWNGIERLAQVPYPVWSPLCLRALWREIGRADAVHVHEYVYAGGLMAMLMARVRRKPVVLTQHTGAVTFSSRLATRLYAAVTRLVGRFAIGRTREVVFVSDNVRRYFYGFCRFDRPPRLVYNGIGPTWRPAVSDEERMRARRAMGIGEARAVVLFVGRFIAKKGLDVIHELVPRFGDVTWLFAGAGPEQPQSWALPNVRVLGPLDPDRLAAAYQASDLLVLPSLSEGFPLVVQEALACGTAVLSTDEVAMACPEAAAMIRAAPIPKMPEHVDQWADALRASLADAGFIADRAARSTRARALWSWSTCAAAYEDTFHAAMSGQGPR